MIQGITLLNNRREIELVRHIKLFSLKDKLLCIFMDQNQSLPGFDIRIICQFNPFQKTKENV